MDDLSNTEREIPYSFAINQQRSTKITTKPKGLLTTVDCHQKMTVKSLTSGIDVMTHGKGTVRTKTAMRKSKLRTRKARAIAAGGNPVTV